MTSVSSEVRIFGFFVSFKILKNVERESMRSRRKVNGGKIKEAVTHVCEVLREYYGIGTITPELLRQSKLGRKAAVRSFFFLSSSSNDVFIERVSKQYMPMWRVLHDLCVVEASNFSVNKDEMNDAWSVLMRKGGIVSSDRVVSYVQLHMYAIGYRREIFQSLKAPPSSSSKHSDDESLYDSKELFLATAWFVAHHKMLETYTARTKRETERHCVLPPYSVDTATLPEFDDETFQTSLRIPDDTKSCSEMLTMLCGRLEKVSKEWTRCQYERTKLVQRYSEIGNLTPLESFLLKHPRRLNEHTNAMRAGLKAAEQIEMWRVFWTWCETVLSPSTKTKRAAAKEEEERHNKVQSIQEKPIRAENIRKLRAFYRKALGDCVQPLLQKGGVVLHDF